MNRAQRTEGAIALVRLGQSQPTIAAALGVGQNTVCQWQNGDRLPMAKHRIAIERHFKIDRALWERPFVSSVRTPAAPSAPSNGSTPRASTAFDLADLIAKEVRDLVTPCDEKGYTARERVASLKAAAGLLRELAEYTGERFEIEERKVLRSPAWKRIQGAVTTALAPFPEAAKAVGEALLALDEERTR